MKIQKVINFVKERMNQGKLCEKIILQDKILHVRRESKTVLVQIHLCRRDIHWFAMVSRPDVLCLEWPPISIQQGLVGRGLTLGSAETLPLTTQCAVSKMLNLFKPHQKYLWNENGNVGAQGQSYRPSSGDVCLKNEWVPSMKFKNWWESVCAQGN